MTSLFTQSHKPLTTTCIYFPSPDNPYNKAPNYRTLLGAGLRPRGTTPLDIYTVYCGSLRPDKKNKFHRIFLKLFFHHEIVRFDRLRASDSAARTDLGYIEGAELSFRHDFGTQIWLLVGNFGLGNEEVRALRSSTQSFR